MKQSDVRQRELTRSKRTGGHLWFTTFAHPTASHGPSELSLTLMPLPTIMEWNMTLVETKPSCTDCPLSTSIAVGNCCVVERVSNWLNSSTTCPKDEELMDLYAMVGVGWTLFCIFQDVSHRKALWCVCVCVKTPRSRVKWFLIFQAGGRRGWGVFLLEASTVYWRV